MDVVPPVCKQGVRGSSPLSSTGQRYNSNSQVPGTAGKYSSRRPLEDQFEPAETFRPGFPDSSGFSCAGDSFQLLTRKDSLSSIVWPPAPLWRADFHVAVVPRLTLAAPAEGQTARFSGQVIHVT